MEVAAATAVEVAVALGVEVGVEVDVEAVPTLDAVGCRRFVQPCETASGKLSS